MTPSNAQTQRKLQKRLPILSTAGWMSIIDPLQTDLSTITASPKKLDDLLSQLPSSLNSQLNPHAPLAIATPHVRSDVCRFFYHHCHELFQNDTENSKLRTVYESFLNHLTHQGDTPSVAASLQETALTVLTDMLIKLNTPQRDLRLLKSHIGLLYRMLDSRGIEQPSTIMLRLPNYDVVSLQCLLKLEKAFPTLLAADVGTLLELSNISKASNAKNTALKTCESTGNIKTMTLLWHLSATVLGHSCELYNTQQQQQQQQSPLSIPGSSLPLACHCTPSTFNGALALAGSSDELTLLEAAAVLQKQPTNSSGFVSPREDTEEDVGSSMQSARSIHEDAAPEQTHPYTPSVPRHIYVGTSPAGVCIGEHLPSPSGVVSAVYLASTVSLTSGQTSSGSLRREIEEAEDALETEEEEEVMVPTAEPSAPVRIPIVPPLPLVREVFNGPPLGSSPSALTNALARSLPPPPTVLAPPPPPVREADVATSSRTSASVSVCGGDELAIVRPQTGPLRRLSMPKHLNTGDIADAPRMLLTRESQRDIKTTISFFISSFPRLPPSTALDIADSLVPMLRIAPPSTDLWRAVERLLTTHSTPLLKIVLTLYDSVPELFTGRGPALMEKVLNQVNDPTLSTDHRVSAGAWVLRCHVRAMHAGSSDLLLKDCWDRLLLKPRDPATLSAVKVKTLARCLTVGVGEAAVVCCSVTDWAVGGCNGLKNKGNSSRDTPTDQQQRSLTYALRVLLSVQCKDATTLRVCLATEIVNILSEKPEFAPAIEELLKQADEEFSIAVLKALDALFSTVEGQFETLVVDAIDATSRQLSSGALLRDYSSTGRSMSFSRVTSALEQRSSSFSGLLRSLSFQWSSTFSTAASSSTAVLPGTNDQAQQQGSVGNFRTASGRNRGRMSFQSNTNTRERESRRRGSSAIEALSGSFSPHSRQGYTRITNVDALRSSVVDAMTPSTDIQTEATPIEATMTSPFASDALLANTPTPAPQPSVVKMPRVSSKESFTTWAAGVTWLSSPSTWQNTRASAFVLKQDVMLYRGLFKMVLSCGQLEPLGVLSLLTNFTRLYKESSSSHLLTAKQTGDTILALCHTTAISHLFIPAENSWSQEQADVAQAVGVVLTALKECFPIPTIRERATKCAVVLGDRDAWKDVNKVATMEVMLGQFVDAAVVQI